MQFTKSAAAFILALTTVPARGAPWHHGSGWARDRNTTTSTTLIYQNNLNASDDANHVSAILLDSMDASSASNACAALNEKLLPKATLQAYYSDFLHSLSYQASTGRVATYQSYYIEDGVVAVAENIGFSFPTVSTRRMLLPVLCTQTANMSTPSAIALNSTQISISSSGNTYIGFRNKKSFRFLGIRYADPPQRFVYSNVYSGKGKTIQATTYGSSCAQTGSGSEDCLFLNIQTPYIPGSIQKHLRPVMFWIHGGGFTGGTGSDGGVDGGNLASREDVVVVSINYRLSTLGFLAIPETNITGNYGIADQITALQWTINNIGNFGGDPKQITILGESAGAGSVRTLLGSPLAIGKFQGAVAMSNLGGGVDLGLSSDYGTTYSSYYTIAESYAVAGQDIFRDAGCNQTSLNAQIACIVALPAATIVGLPSVARYVVQDGKYVNTEQLVVSVRNASTAHVPVIFGVTRSDGASLASYPTTPITSELAGIQAALGVSAVYAQAIIDSGLFPLYDTGNITADTFNVSQRVAEDKVFRCIDQATVYAGAKSHAFERAYYYQMQRTAYGYNPNNVDSTGPITPGYPLGNPNLPYYALHGSDVAWVFGNVGTYRDANDLYALQLYSGYFAEFAKSGQPNPSARYLQTRGYVKTLQGTEQTGPWKPVEGNEGPIKLLDYPSADAPFQDVAQCGWLNYTLSYYLDSNRG